MRNWSPIDRNDKRAKRVISTSKKPRLIDCKRTNTTNRVEFEINRWSYVDTVCAAITPRSCVICTADDATSSPSSGIERLMIDALPFAVCEKKTSFGAYVYLQRHPCSAKRSKIFDQHTPAYFRRITITLSALAGATGRRRCNA
jgi:hypothetical protein